MKRPRPRPKPRDRRLVVYDMLAAGRSNAVIAKATGYTERHVRRLAESRRVQVRDVERQIAAVAAYRESIGL